MSDLIEVGNVSSETEDFYRGVASRLGECTGKLIFSDPRNGSFEGTQHKLEVVADVPQATTVNEQLAS